MGVPSMVFLPDHCPLDYTIVFAKHQCLEGYGIWKGLSSPSIRPGTKFLSDTVEGESLKSLDIQLPFATNPSVDEPLWDVGSN